MLARHSKKIVIVLLVITAVVILAWLGMVRLQRQGKTAVEVIVAPDDSTLTINGQVSRPGIHYLKPDKYSFKAERSGFTTVTKQVNVSGEDMKVGLAPIPSSPEAEEFLQDNPDIQLQREALGALEHASRSDGLTQKAPIVELLPYSDIGGPFTLNYGESKNRNNGVLIIVSDSSPNGRQKALQWMRENGSDPTGLEIRFEDFVNPLTTGGAR